MKIEGVALAVASSAIMKGQIPALPITNSILNNHNPERSGDIFVVFKSHWFINEFDDLTVAATHGSPWSYDTYVPIIFAGANLKPERVLRRVYTVDIASTLSEVFNTNRPSGSTGEILEELIK